MLKTIRNDIRAIMEKDPAAVSVLEVVLCSPGLHALIGHRMASALRRLRIPLLPRLISHLFRWLTGIEIHPGAKIGQGVVIDHGMGVVIGETAEVGDNSLIFQGVTLGGTSNIRGKRHPTLGRNVTVGAGAAVLGPITVGDNARVGAGAVVVKPVPSCCTVVGIPGRVVERKRLHELRPDQEAFPDPDSMVLGCILRRLDALERAVPDGELQRQVQQRTCVFQKVGAAAAGNRLAPIASLGELSVSVTDERKPSCMAMR